MKNLLVYFLLFCSNYAYSQFYYADVVGTGQTNQQYKLIESQRLKRISAAGFEPNNEPSKDFLLEQEVNAKAQQIVTRSATIGNVESYFTSTYQNNRISRTYDSNANAINMVEYTYDTKGNLLSTRSTSKDFDGQFMSTETHLWNYNDDGLPTQMLKIKNGSDTTFVTFKLEDNNVSEEVWVRNRREIERFYYYYNARKQLTDIVKFNRKAKQLLPDYMFEYDNSGRINQMTQAQATSANYLIYRYSYNDRGLKEREQVYNKKKEYLGKIEYSYQ